MDIRYVIDHTVADMCHGMTKRRKKQPTISRTFSINHPEIVELTVRVSQQQDKSFRGGVVACLKMKTPPARKDWRTHISKYKTSMETLEQVQVFLRNELHNLHRQDYSGFWGHSGSDSSVMYLLTRGGFIDSVYKSTLDTNRSICWKSTPSPLVGNLFVSGGRPV